MPKTSLNMLKTIEKRQNLPEKCPRFFGFFCIFLQTKIFTIFLVLKTKRNNDENKQNFARVIINSYRFCGIV
jgi:hypothetical protein